MKNTDLTAAEFNKEVMASIDKPTLAQYKAYQKMGVSIGATESLYMCASIINRGQKN